MSAVPARAAQAGGPPDPLDWQDHRFLALDGLRFVAALVVVWFHCLVVLDIDGVPHGYLMVDFFFGLSGFVLAHAYDERLRRGGFLAPFLLRRAVRLYPLCALASALGFAINPGDHPTVRDMLLGFGLIPQFEDWLFPVDIPLWSLFFEAVVNVVYAAVLVRLPGRALVALFAASTCYTLVFCHWNDGVNLGGHVENWQYGVFRTFQSFAAGVLLCRWRRRAPRGSAVRAALPAVCLAPLAAVLYGIARVPGIEHGNGAYDAAVVVVVFPLVLACAAAVRAGPRLRPLLALGGEISYPLYVVHYPLLGAFVPMASHARAAEDATLLAVTLAACAAAYAVYRFYDRPVRRWLTGRLPGLGAAPRAGGPGEAHGAEGVVESSDGRHRVPSGRAGAAGTGSEGGR